VSMVFVTAMVFVSVQKVIKEALAMSVIPM